MRIIVSRTRIRNLARSLDLPEDDLVLWLLEHEPQLGERHPADFLPPEIEAKIRTAHPKQAPSAAPPQDEKRAERRCAACMDAGASTSGIMHAEGGAPCDRCGGSVNKREALALIDAFGQRGLRRLLVVGGGPGTATELRQLLSNAIELRIVDGESYRDATQAASELAWADIVAIWASTILPHKISKLYTDRRADYRDKLVTVTRRGTAALCMTVVEKVSAGSAARV
jgi:hypothetical protein